MNQILNSRSGDAVRAGRDLPTGCKDLESIVATSAGDGCVPLAVGGTVPAGRRVLLIESDVCLQETLRYYLAESGYTVVAFQNSVDALKAVLADDFALVLYDVMTPGLRGGIFYNSVERIDPELCERFVFMTCDRMDASTAEFIMNINGFVLRKPFDSLDLLDALLSAEVRGTLEGVFDRPTSIPDTLTPEDGGRAPVAGADAGAKRLPHAVDAEAWEKGSVLLIEGDPCFRETVRYYLAETGHTVVACQNSRDGLKEVLAGDFALVLYDPTTPGLPADMFYQGVRRIDPELCERVVFVIGDRNDATTGAFIQKIDGFVLRKPFDAKILADKIAAAGVLGSLHGAFESALSDPDLSRACLSVDEGPAAVPPRPQVAWFAERLSEALAPEPAAALTQEPALPGRFRAPIQLADVIPAIESRAPLPGVLRVFAFAGLALLGVLLVARWSQYRDARDSAAAASAKQEAIETEWLTTSRELQTATAMRPKIEAEIRKLERFTESRALPRWSPALRFLVTARDAKIDIQEVTARGHTEDLGACEVRIRGVADGSQSRLMAERFRQAVEASFKGNADGRRARARFEQLEDVPGVSPDQKRAAFLMVATVDSIKASGLITKEGR